MARVFLLLLFACRSPHHGAPKHDAVATARSPSPPAPADEPPPADAAPHAGAAPAWHWDPAPDLFPRLDLTAGNHTVTLAKRGLVLRGPSWSADLSLGHDELTGAAIAADASRVFVAFYNRIATGCHLAAFDAATGKPLWSVPLDGIGPISHSKYSNRVQLRMVNGHPTVFGSEAQRYIEQRDAATGALVSHQLLPAERQPIPISEPLYRELDHMLATRATYTVMVNDFLARHVAMTDADHASRGAAFAEALRRLDRLPIVRGAHRLQLRLVDT